MATIKRFEHLECWKEARKLVKLTYDLTKRPEFKMDFTLVRQVRASAVSTMANIAEGFHRNSNKDFLRFLGYSRASIAETLSHLYAAVDQNYICISDMNIVKKQADVVWKKVNNFISYLNSTQNSRLN